MRKMEFRDKWHPCDLSMIIALSGVTESPGTAQRVPVKDIYTSLQAMPGIKECYASGYIVPQESLPPSLESMGEFVILRTDNAKDKAYNYLFASSGDQRFFNGPYKLFDGHHAPSGSGISISKCFGNIPPNGSS